MSGQVKALVSADQPLIRIYGGDGEYAEIQFETQDDANAAVERFNEVLKKAMLDTGSSRSASQYSRPSLLWLGCSYRTDFTPADYRYGCQWDEHTLATG